MTNKNILTFFAMTVATLLVGFGSASAETFTITSEAGSGSSMCADMDNCYLPSSLMVTRGSNVSYENNDSVPHTITAGYASGAWEEHFDTGLLNSETKVTFGGTPLNSDGIIPYFCMLHPWMVGEIVVVKDIYDQPIDNIPHWFEEVQQWHNEGKIPDREYYWAIGYLEDDNLLT